MAFTIKRLANLLLFSITVASASSVLATPSEILVWWQMQRDDAPILVTDLERLIGNEQDSQLDTSELKLRFPIADLDEQALLSADFLDQSDSLKSASARYDYPYYAAVSSTSNDSGSTVAHWVLYSPGGRENGVIEEASLEKVVSSLQRAWVKVLADEYKEQTSEEKALFHVVLTEPDFISVANVERVLQPLNPQLVSMSQHNVRWVVSSAKPRILDLLSSNQTTERLISSLMVESAESDPVKEQALMELKSE